MYFNASHPSLLSSSMHIYISKCYFLFFDAIYMTGEAPKYLIIIVSTTSSEISHLKCWVYKYVVLPVLGHGTILSLS